MEEWKDVVGYEEYFQISNFGRVFSKRTNKILIQGISKSGYYVLSTRIGGKRGICKCFKVHRLVAMAFIPNNDNKPFVNHKDGNKLNPCVDNLEWCTAKENSVHAWENELCISVKGTAQKSSKLKESDVIYCRNNYIPRSKQFGTGGLAKKFNVNHSIISNLLNRKTWKHI